MIRQEEGKARKERKPAEVFPVVMLKPHDQYLTPMDVVEQVALIKHIQEAVMIEGIHYGKIAGCNQPSLYKAGAEKLRLTFRLAVNPIIEDLSNPDEIRYRVKMEVTTEKSGTFIGSGVGECSSNEEKYKWREAVSDKEWETTLESQRRIKQKKYFDKRAGGYNTYEVKQIRTQPADLANTILKMAKKRAFVDAILTCTAASDCFMQDLEDIEENLREHLLAEEKDKNAKASVEMPQKKNERDKSTEDNLQQPKDSEAKITTEPVKNGNDKKITPQQVSVIEKCCKNRGLKLDDVTKEFKVGKIEDLPMDKLNPVLEWLSGFENK